MTPIMVASPPRDHIDTLIKLFADGRFMDVCEQVEPLIESYPNSFVLWNILGAANKKLGHLDEAARGFRKATELNPDFPEAYNNLGVTLLDQGNHTDAIAACRRAIEMKPDYAEAHFNLGNSLKKQREFDKAISSYRRAIEIQPKYVSAFNNMGIALNDQGNFDMAIVAFQKAIAIQPFYVDAIINYGSSLKNLGRIDQAIAVFQQAIALAPENEQAHYNLGNALRQQYSLAEAVLSYKRALEINPIRPETINNLGTVFQRLGKVDEAIVTFQNAISVDPNHAEAHYNLGIAFQGQGKLKEALRAYQHALEINPDDTKAEAQIRFQRRNLCDWRSETSYVTQIEDLGITTDAVSPFALLSAEDCPERQMMRSKRWAFERPLRSARPLVTSQKSEPNRIKIGYFSADFHDHATLFLILGLLREHDRSRFEVFAYSYGRNRNGEWRTRAQELVDHFVDVSEMPDNAILELARSHGLHIAIDLKGYTTYSRSEIFQLRLAPIQVNFLGYPSTMGTQDMDYIIADSTVIPTEYRDNYTESVIFLPGSYYPNDSRREIAATKSKRSDFGLPSDAFVFCCFCNNYKISRTEFEIWMRLLSQIDDSVLWLLESNRWAQENLRKEARFRGIDPNRLVFADFLPAKEHLARHKHADLFVDTFNYNAHTTACDALWSGLPIVTKVGRQFAARVGASVLTAVGLPELITTTNEAYEAKILELAVNRDELANLKAKLSTNRLTTLLFDSKTYTRHFETGLELAFRRYREDKPLSDIWVG